jgi:hypothetical protein
MRPLYGVTLCPTVTGVCCPPGSINDASGACCAAGVLDACGVCNGTGVAVDIRGKCCRSPLPPSGICCEDGLDSCGVCGGSSACMADVSIRVNVTSDVVANVTLDLVLACLGVRTACNCGRVTIMHRMPSVTVSVVAEASALLQLMRWLEEWRYAA